MLKNDNIFILGNENIKTAPAQTPETGVNSCLQSNFTEVVNTPDLPKLVRSRLAPSELMFIDFSDDKIAALRKIAEQRKTRVVFRKTATKILRL